MNLAYKELPTGLKINLKPYAKKLTKPQKGHFSTLIIGLIVHGNKTVQEINDALSNGNQSSLNRFLNNHDFTQHNATRLAYVQHKLPTQDDGLIIIDDFLAHKTGKHMEAAGWHRSGITKKKEGGHSIVNSYYTHPKWPFGYPITAEICVDKNVPGYRSKKHMALDQVEYAVEHGVRGIICADSLFYADYAIHELDDQNKQYLLGAPSTLKISIGRKSRISLEEYAKKIRFKRIWMKSQWYHIHIVKASIRGVGTRRVVISYREKDPDIKKCYVTNLTYSSMALLQLLVCRWRIEIWHRDAKQLPGMEDYQVRKDRAVRNVVLAILIAYTILVLSMQHTTIRRLSALIGRALNTIGELCRFMNLAARKKWRWITKLMREESGVLKEVLNREVLVKNAKV